MNKATVIAEFQRRFTACPGNTLTEANAIAPELVGLSLFDAPLIGVAKADDPLFEVFRAPEVIGPWHKSPLDWLPGAKSVLSLFLPFTEPVRVSNRGARTDPSPQWLHGRVEGQAFINAFTERLRDWLTEQGFEACVPALDPGFQAYSAKNPLTGQPDDSAFGSNWSERHAAYVCGLGTFGLSKGLITRKGMAGRFCSVITNLELEPDLRSYTGVYDNCTLCGACVRRCPVQAISLETGKDHRICKVKQDESSRTFAPRYGCGLCQTGVPCEHQIPIRPAKNP